MIIDENVVSRVAGLVKLKLEPAELAFYQKQLGQILQYMEQLAAVPRGELGDMSNVAEYYGHERDDIEMPSLGPEAALKQAPVSQAQHFQVPRVIE